jgi:hypothetical protein
MRYGVALEDDPTAVAQEARLVETRGLDTVTDIAVLRGLDRSFCADDELDQLVDLIEWFG